MLSGFLFIKIEKRRSSAVRLFRRNFSLGLPDKKNQRRSAISRISFSVFSQPRHGSVMDLP